MAGTIPSNLIAGTTRGSNIDESVNLLKDAMVEILGLTDVIDKPVDAIFQFSDTEDATSCARAMILSAAEDDDPFIEMNAENTSVSPDSYNGWRLGLEDDFDPDDGGATIGEAFVFYKYDYSIPSTGWIPLLAISSTVFWSETGGRILSGGSTGDVDEILEGTGITVSGTGAGGTGDVTVSLATSGIENSHIAVGVINANKLSSRDVADVADLDEGLVLMSDGDGDVSWEEIPVGAGVASVTAADTTVVVGGTSVNPTVKTGVIENANIADDTIEPDKLEKPAFTAGNFYVMTSGGDDDANRWEDIDDLVDGGGSASGSLKTAYFESTGMYMPPLTQTIPQMVRAGMLPATYNHGSNGFSFFNTDENMFNSAVVNSNIPTLGINITGKSLPAFGLDGSVGVYDIAVDFTSMICDAETGVDTSNDNENGTIRAYHVQLLRIVNDQGYEAAGHSGITSTRFVWPRGNWKYNQYGTAGDLPSNTLDEDLAWITHTIHIPFQIPSTGYTQGVAILARQGHNVRGYTIPGVAKFRMTYMGTA